MNPVLYRDPKGFKMIELIKLFKNGVLVFIMRSRQHTPSFLVSKGRFFCVAESQYCVFIPEKIVRFFYGVNYIRSPTKNKISPRQSLSGFKSGDKVLCLHESKTRQSGDIWHAGTVCDVLGEVELASVQCEVCVATSTNMMGSVYERQSLS